MVPLIQRGQVRHNSAIYGRSREGVDLKIWLPQTNSFRILLMASIHGDEAEGTTVLSEALRSIDAADLQCGVILCANPDGAMRGTRCNSAGVDLNRNMPASNWQKGQVFYKSLDGEPQSIALDTGAAPGSEPENQALIRLLETYQPEYVLTLHGSLACIDDPNATGLGKVISQRTGLPHVKDVGYPTPGSFGSWAQEHKLKLITYELEAASLYQLKRNHVPVLVEILEGRLAFEE